MEDMESPVEHLQEKLHHIAEHSGETWLKWSALLSALFAVLAAISGLQSAHYADRAMIEQIEASDQWSFYQAKGIKAKVIESQKEILSELGKTTEDQTKKIEKYATEQEEIKKIADEKVHAAKEHLEKHEVLARGVTLYQVAIAMIAITVLTRRKHFLLLAGALGVVASYFLVTGLLM